MVKGDAAYYQAHKDDPDEWGAADQSPNPPHRLAVVVSVRFSADEEAMMRTEAAKRGQTLSSFIRTSALDKCRTGTPAALPLSYQAAPTTGSGAFGGQIVFPGGRLELTGKPAAAASALPTS